MGGKVMAEEVSSFEVSYASAYFLCTCSACNRRRSCCKVHISCSMIFEAESEKIELFMYSKTSSSVTSSQSASTRIVNNSPCFEPLSLPTSQCTNLAEHDI